MCDNNFPCLVASLFSWRCLAASNSYFLHTAMIPRLPSVTVSSHTSAANAVAFQSPAMPNAWLSLCTQSVHSFSFPPCLLCPTPLRFPKTIRFGSHPPLIRISTPVHKKVLSCATLSECSHAESSQGRGCAPTV